MKRRIIAIILSMLILMAFTACGKADPSKVITDEGVKIECTPNYELSPREEGEGWEFKLTPEEEDELLFLRDQGREEDFEWNCSFGAWNADIIGAKYFDKDGNLLYAEDNRSYTRVIVHKDYEGTNIAHVSLRILYEGEILWKDFYRAEVA